ncbi:MAG: DUF2059 domain-containing protein [Pseudomonadota bacterium]
MLKRHAAVAGFVLAVLFTSGPASAGSYEKAREMVEVAGVRESIELVIPMAVDEALSGLAAQGANEQSLALLREVFIDEITDAIPEYLDLVASVYARHFSDSELTEIIVFYETPVGRKMVAKTPNIISESEQAAAGWMLTVLSRIGENLEEKLRERGLAA